MKYRAVLFDFDGTLADSFAAITASTNHARQTFGLPEMAESEVRTYVGLGLKHLLAKLVPTAPNVEKAVSVYREHHETVAIPMTRLLPGVRETVDGLSRRKIAMGVCSNKSVSFTRKLVQHLFPKNEMPLVLGPEDVAQPKPDPGMLFEACKRLNMDVSQVVYVGDMIVDVLTAHDAKMDVWLVPGGAGGEQGWQEAIAAKPTKVLDRFTDILGF